MLRSILSVVAGFALWSVLWLVATFSVVLAAAPEFRPDGSTDNTAILVLFLGLSLAFSIGSGYLTGRIAGRKAITHAFALGAILLIVGIAVQMQYWNLMPLWYHVAFLALLVPGALFGGQRAG